MNGTTLTLGAVGALALSSLISDVTGGANRVPIRDVPEYWRQGRPAKGDGGLVTDGNNLYSYKLRIGWTGNNGLKILGEYTSHGDFESKMTSKHVGYARGHADLIVNPGDLRI